MVVTPLQLTENKGALAGALVVREHQELVFISQNGMVQRTSVRGINRYGRASQGVKVMNIRDDDQVSAVALVVESDTSTAAPVVGDDLAALVADGEAPEVGEADAAEPETDAGEAEADASDDGDAGDQGDAPGDGEDASDA
jgi:DNA gyrase subunit A